MELPTFLFEVTVAPEVLVDHRHLVSSSIVSKKQTNGIDSPHSEEYINS